MANYNITLISKNGQQRDYGQVPDCWHAYTWLGEHGNPKMGSGVSLADMVLDCWHMAHDYRDVLKGVEQARLVDGYDEESIKPVPLAIHKKAVMWALCKNYVISVTDYSAEADEWDIEDSRNYHEILAAIEATELPNVYIYDVTTMLDGTEAARKRIVAFSVIDEGQPDETINDYTAKPGGPFDTWMEEEFNRLHGAPIVIDAGAAK